MSLQKLQVFLKTQDFKTLHAVLLVLFSPWKFSWYHVAITESMEWPLMVWCSYKIWNSVKWFRNY